MKDRIYRQEDEDAERRVGAEFAEAWGLVYRQVGGMSKFDGLLCDQPGNAPAVVRFIFELKNRNVCCDGQFVIANGKKYDTMPLSKAKVESLHTESVRRGIPALLIVHAKHGKTTWWVDVAQLVNLPVRANSGRTASPMRPSDIEDCVYIPVTWFAPMEQRYGA